MKLILPFILLLIPTVFSQTDSISVDIYETTEDLFQENEEESDNSAAYEYIEEKLASPVDLNSAEIKELMSIPFSDLNTANKILEHRKKFGHFFSTSELYSVKDIPPDVISKLLPFFTVRPLENQHADQDNSPERIERDFKINARSRALKDVQYREAYKENKYSGSGVKYYNRFNAEYFDKFQIGVLAEKDAGEKSLSEFASFFITLKDLGFLKNFIAGDYYIECGQGITLWSPYAFSKGSEAVFPVKKQSRNIRPYKSTDENRFFRGAAGEIMIGSFTLTGFYSENRFDAVIDTFSNSISSLQLTGLHRTDNEVKKRKTAAETILGSIFDYSSGSKINLNIGAAYFRSKFTHPLPVSEPYDIKRNKFDYGSFYYNIYWGGLNLFGELSYNGISAASINGLIISSSRDFSFITSIRSYPRNYFSLHGAPMAEHSAKNELGFYSGIKWRTKIGVINFYYDQFKFPYAGNSVPLPSGGSEMLLNLRSKPLPKFETGIRIKYENKETGGYENLNRIIVNQIKRSIRFDLVYNASGNIRIKGRFEINNCSIKELNTSETGILFYQDFRIALIKKITLSGRVIFFRTDSFSSAVYGYENDLPGVSANPAMYGQGVKWYLLMHFKVLKGIILSCKYSELYKPEEKFLYTGDDRISGNIDNKIGIQLDINF